MRNIRYTILLLPCLLTAVLLQAADQPALNPAYTAYIEQWRETALAQQTQYGIPAAITLAQGLLESGAGQSDLATQANNHFGIKCHSDWQGGTFRKDDDQRDECFRSYQRAEDSYRDHSLFLKRKRYEVLFTYDIKDYKAWANGLKACGYATDPGYPQKLIRIIETYGLNTLQTPSKGGVKESGKTIAESQQPKVEPQKPKAESGKTKPTGEKKKKEDSKPAVKEQKEQKSGTAIAVAAQTDTVVWRPAQFRANALYATRAYGKTNGQKFIVAQEGDTWGGIAFQLGMEEKTLRRINDATPKQALRGGDKIYLFPKRNKADKRHKTHLVKTGETAWDIAQQYGIRLSSLYKLNGIPEGTPLTTQQWLDLR